MIPCSGSPIPAAWHSARHAVAVALLTCAACPGTTARPASTAAAPLPSRIVNLHAFARLYGVLRWFHPSDSAQAIDWDRFAVDGARRVLDAPDSRTLRATLAEVIAPVAPAVRLAAGDEPFAAEPPVPPAAAGNLDVVAWEHEGYGDTTIHSVYASKRRHRERTIAVPGQPVGALWQAVEATPLRGARVRIRGKIRTADHGAGRLWLRVDRGDSRGFYDTMRDRPVVSARWEAAEIVGRVDSDATRIVFGPMMTGGGTVWYDDLELSVEGRDGQWQAVPIRDPSFESTDLFESWGAGTGTASPAPLDGWSATLDHLDPASGGAALRVAAITKVVTDELFADAPAPGETVDVDLGQGLRARVPLALASRDGRTVGDDPAVARRSQAAAPSAAPPGFDLISGVADVIVAWNVLEHFWPYWSIVPVDWTAELDQALGDALDDRSVDDHVATLRRMSAAAPDGHARTTCNGASPRAYPPFTVEVLEGQIVVTTTGDQAVARGDVIVSVDGRPAGEQLAADLALTSGSPQYRRVLAYQQFGAGPVGSTVALRVRRGGAELDVAVARGEQLAEQFSRPPIDRLDDGVYYVDLGRAPMPDIKAVIDRLAAAPGVVFDLRGYPKGNDDVLSYLLTQAADFTEGMSIPHVIRPDHVAAAVPTWETASAPIPVLAPHLGGRIAFLTGPGAISYAESVMAIVEHYHLGEIVGAATAGTNGNIAEITGPSGCRTTFTGMRVVKRNGTRHHLVGVQPTIPVSRTIAGVAAGRDEVLDQALAYVRGPSR